MKVLVTGATGQLGCEVLRELKAGGIKCLDVVSAASNITDFIATKQFITAYFSSVVRPIVSGEYPLKAQWLLYLELSKDGVGAVSSCLGEWLDG